MKILVIFDCPNMYFIYNFIKHMFQYQKRILNVIKDQDTILNPLI